jgi:hypothetical protein
MFGIGLTVISTLLLVYVVRRISSNQKLIEVTPKKLFFIVVLLSGLSLSADDFLAMGAVRYGPQQANLLESRLQPLFFLFSPAFFR